MIFIFENQNYQIKIDLEFFIKKKKILSLNMNIVFLKTIFYAFNLKANKIQIKNDRTFLLNQNIKKKINK